jgi:hypothetical protein
MLQQSWPIAGVITTISIISLASFHIFPPDLLEELITYTKTLLSFERCNHQA